MDLNPTPQERRFRDELRAWLEAHAPRDWEARYPATGNMEARFAFLRDWQRQVYEAGWAGLSWPAEYGGRGATLMEKAIFTEEMARIGAPPLPGILGLELVGPTLIAFGTPGQKARFLPPIRNVRELWCQGYSEPGAGSDLASVSTRAVCDGAEWVITGQKIWTSGAHEADWCFVLARTEPGSSRGRGLSYLLVPMRQPGITVRPIRQLTGTSEFNEVFFDGARTAAENVVGEPGDGWRIAKATLAIERGAAMLGQQVGFRRELADLLALARQTEAGQDPLLRDRLARAWIGLEVVRAYALDTLDGDEPESPAEASVLKILWSRWHQGLGELAMDVLGAPSVIASGDPYDQWQRLFLFSRADTIYGGSDEIQRNIIASRILPRHDQPGEARP